MRSGADFQRSAHEIKYRESKGEAGYGTKYFSTLIIDSSDRDKGDHAGDFTVRLTKDIHQIKVAKLHGISFPNTFPSISSRNNIFRIAFDDTWTPITLPETHILVDPQTEYEIGTHSVDALAAYIRTQVLATHAGLFSDDSTGLGIEHHAGVNKLTFTSSKGIQVDFTDPKNAASLFGFRGNTSYSSTVHESKNVIISPYSCNFGGPSHIYMRLFFSSSSIGSNPTPTTTNDVFAVVPLGPQNMSTWLTKDYFHEWNMSSVNLSTLKVQFTHTDGEICDLTGSEVSFVVRVWHNER